MAAEPTFNPFGFCTECGLDRDDGERYERLQQRQVISVVDRHSVCGHVLTYRTLKREWR